MSYNNGFYNQRYNSKSYDAPPPLPPKPPKELVQNNRNVDAVGDILADYDINTTSPRLNERRASQIRGPRQPSANSRFGQSPQPPSPRLYQQHVPEYYYPQPPAPAPAPPPVPPPPPSPLRRYSYSPPNLPTVPSMIDTSYPIDTTSVHAVIDPAEPESCSVSSIPSSSICRNTSTNTTYSRMSMPDEKDYQQAEYSPVRGDLPSPDKYEGFYYEQPTEVPRATGSPNTPYETAMHGYFDNGENLDESPSFMADIRNELNNNNSPTKSRSPIPRCLSTSPHRTPTRKQRDLDRISSGSSTSSEVKFYGAYNRTNEEVVEEEEEEQQQKPPKGPQRMKTVGASSVASHRPTELTLPRSTSAREKSFFLHANGGDTLDSSLRSSSRSTADYTLMNALDLPSIPASKNVFDSQKLSSRDYDRCSEPWSLQCVAEWLSGYYNEDGETPFTELSKALVGLFTHHVPTLNWFKAEKLATDALQSIIDAEFITLLDDYDNEKGEEDEQLVRLNLDKEVSGVLPLMTHSGCYSNRGHETSDESSYRCYAPRCSRTLAMRPSVNQTELQNQESSTDWATYWNIDRDVIQEMDKRVAKRQYAIHELIVGEEGYIRDLNTLIKVYGESLERCNPPIMKNQDEFYENAFASVKALIECNSKHLLSAFKFRQSQQGPHLEGIADIMLTWIKEARKPYTDYADSYLLADRKLRQEREFNPQFAQWFDRVSKDPRAKGAPHSFYFHRAIPRLARYGLLLKTIQKATLETDPEYKLLSRAITECDEITGECNKRLAMMEKQVEIMDLQQHIRFKGQDQTADLRLKDGKRKIFRRGDVLRRGDYRMDWVSTHLMLFDNFLVLSKVRKGVNGTLYYVTKRPIPLDLLVLESVTDEPVTKSSSSKLGVGTLTYHVGAAQEKRMSFMAAGGAPMTTAAANSSSEASATTLGDPDRELMFPFKISHLGRNGHTFTLYAPSKMDRDRWRDAIIAAKREYSSAVYALNAEPFRMKVISEDAFGYDVSSAPKLAIAAPATALDRALQSTRESRADKQMSRPLAKSRINCGVSFVFADGQEYTLLGLDYGVYVKNAKSGSYWRRCIDIFKVTQIDVVEELNVMVVLADKALVYYDLDSVLTMRPNLGRNGSTHSAPTTASHSHSNSNPIGHRLSRHREVGFFSVGHMKDRTMLFYKRREGMSSTFKVIEPVKEKGSQRKRSKMVFSRSAVIGSTEYFREVEKFYVPTEAYGISLFKTSFAVHTTRGFEVMSLDMKLPQTVPATNSVTNSNLAPIYKKSGNGSGRIPSAESVKKRLESTKPVGMFRVSESSLVVCYEDFAMYCDNHGNIVGPSVVEFVGKARDVALQHPYLLIFDDEMVEVRRIDQGGQLKQVISGKDIRAIDTREGQIKIALAHPELVNRQLVVELVGNDFVVEDDNSSLAGL